MNNDLLRKSLNDYIKKLKSEPERRAKELAEREERAVYYQSWTEEKMLKMTEDDFYEYFSKLWALRTWGNKRWAIENMYKDNTFDYLKKELSNLVWSSDPVEKRWDRFRNNVSNVGPAMMSEILCHVQPKEYMLWNRRAYVALNYLGIQNLPKYNYQNTGKKYKELCETCKGIASEMQAMGISNANLLTVDYFLWEELQVVENLSQMFQSAETKSQKIPIEEVAPAELKFIHNEIRDKISNIGSWLGFKSSVETKIAHGAVVDAVWEATIGNMGRVIYVFEVQTKGSVDSLAMNLLKSLNNPAVQGVVAVSDAAQIEKIKSEVSSISGLKDKLKYWDYQEVLQVYEALELVNDSINSLGLVPQGF